MGDENSLAGVTKAHKHTTASSDGSSLEASTTTFSLSNQSILVSDGTTINELGVGNESDTLSVSSGNVAWTAGATGSEVCYIPVGLTENGLRNNRPYYGVLISDGSSPVFGKTLTDVSFFLRKGGTPEGDGYVYCIDSAGVVQATSNSPTTWDALTTSWQKITFTISHTVSAGDRIVIGGGTVGIGKEVSMYADNSASNTSFQSTTEYDSSTSTWLIFNSGVSGVKWCFTGS